MPAVRDERHASRRLRLFRAVVAFVPGICLAAFVVLVMTATIRGGGDPTGHGVFADGVLRVLLLGVAGGWGGLPLFLSHLAANQSLHPARRSRWRLGLRLYAPLAMPLYWTRYMRRAPQAISGSR